MGMGIDSSSATWASQSPTSLQSSPVSNWQQRQSGLQALSSALQSGDLASAQSAYSAISANNPNISSSSPLGQIGAALQSGDIAGAQKLASSMHTGRMHGHRGGNEDGNQSGSNSATDATGTAFLSAFLGAISPAASTTPTSSTGASDPTSSSSNPLGTSLSGVASPSVNQITQDVTSFLQIFSQRWNKVQQTRWVHHRQMYLAQHQALLVQLGPQHQQGMLPPYPLNLITRVSNKVTVVQSISFQIICKR